MLMPTRILVPTDFSEYSDKALEQALDIAKQYHAKVYLVHVLPDDIYHISGTDFVIPDQLQQQARNAQISQVEERFRSQLDKYPQTEDVDVETSIRKGIPYDAILAEAADKKIDLIVIASLGRSGIAKYLIGGVARNVLKGAKCPVLLTK